MNKRGYEYASAPYNFIPLPKEVVYRHRFSNINTEEIDKELRHDIFDSESKSGYIQYSIKVETPLFIDNGKENFFKVGNKEVIPGSTLRGKVRSNAEILSYAYPKFIESKKLWHRGCFESTKLKHVYYKTIKLSKKSRINDYVKAGYLKREKGKWVIYPALEDKDKRSFRTIHEKDVKNLIDEFPENLLMYKSIEDKPINEFWKELDKKKNERKDLLKKKVNTRNIDDDIKKLLRDQKNYEFKFYYMYVNYSINGENKKIAKLEIIENYNKLDKKNKECIGMLMNSTNLGNKVHHYLIYEKDIKKVPKSISDEVLNQYKTNVRLKQENIVEDFELHDNESNNFYKEKPIFYILNDKREIASFGFTPYLKIPYGNSIGELIPKYKEKNINYLDYIDSIFGFINGNESYKGRVSFTNAKIDKSCQVKFQKSCYKILSSPKVSSFQLYLKQPNVNERKFWNDQKFNYKGYKKTLNTYSDDSEIRGNKFYWLRDKSNNKDQYRESISKDRVENNENSKEIRKEIKPIEIGTKFTGKIYFENLKDDEIGLLLMAIKPFEDAKDNLGKGKPYGFGKVSFKIEEIKEIDNSHRFDSVDISYKKYSESLDLRVEKYIKYFKETINNCIRDLYKGDKNSFDFDTEERIKCFKASKTNEKRINDNEFNYMELQDKRLKNRNILKSMDEYISSEEIHGEKYAAIDKIITE
ncbi:TIGR03986 family type III CRISPR-associated RAMP protein [Clostridium lundense]|uniref:TIGR03986 family type III CRISPR-associated RAMP protein n=1 Tax=Clostridium lundense TaxID=319475 RepID=UPI0006858498|nr:TIGR03986 family CRISPR-associated RAMP protein [Clostridium lundense]